MSALQARPRGRNQGEAQESRLQRWLLDKKPAAAVEAALLLWEARALQALIELKFGLKMSLRTVQHYLVRWNFTPQRPARRALEQQPPW